MANDQELKNLTQAIFKLTDKITYLTLELQRVQEAIEMIQVDFSVFQADMHEEQ